MRDLGVDVRVELELSGIVGDGITVEDIIKQGSSRPILSNIMKNK